MTKTLETVEPNLQAILAQYSKKPASLSLDVDLATCQVLAALSGDSALPADAFSLLIDHNEKIRESPTKVIEGSLSRQSVLLEALWLHFAARAAKATRPDHAAGLVKAALNCQRALASVLGTIHHLNETQQDAQAIIP